MAQAEYMGPIIMAYWLGKAGIGANCSGLELSSSGGHAQINAVMVWLLGWKTVRATPVAPIATARTPHLCCCRVRRTVSVAISSQPNPKRAAGPR
jgi:hypothetical protein